MTAGEGSIEVTGRGPEVEAPDRSEVGAAVVLASLAAAVYLGLAQAHGALGASRNDDWAYYRVAYELADRGRFELNGWSQMMLVGQALLAWPIVKVFGPEIAPLQVAVAALGAVGLWAAYLVVRGFLPRGWSALALGCLALGPLYGTLSVSFMTDVPAFSFQMLALLAGQRTLRSKVPSTAWFVASLCLALAAFSIREYGIAALVAVSLVVWSRARAVDPRLARRLAALTVVGFAAAVGLFAWRSTLAHSTPNDLRLPLDDFNLEVGTLWVVALTLALFVAPAVAAISPARLVRATRATAPTIGLLVGVASALLAVKWGPGVVGNYFTRDGSYTLAITGSPPPVVPTLAWNLFRWLALASFVAIALVASLALVERVRRPGTPGWSIRSLLRLPDLSRPSALAEVFTAAAAAVIVGLTLATASPFFDRYLIGLTPFVAALVIKAARDRQLLGRSAGRVAGASLAALGVVGLTFVDASATYDGGRWKLASDVEELGVDPATIDGGFEWWGYHQSDPTEHRAPEDGLAWWVTIFSERPVCATVSYTGTDEARPRGDRNLDSAQPHGDHP